MSRRSDRASSPEGVPEQLALPLWSETAPRRPPRSSESPSDQGVATEPERPGVKPAPAAEPAPTTTATARSFDPADSPGARLSDLVPRYLEFAAAIDRSPHTIHTVRVDLALLIRFLGDRPASTVDLDDLRHYASWLRQERKNDSRSLRRKVASVKAFFAYLRQQGIRESDPSERLIYPSAEPHLPEFLETDEEAKLLAAVDRPMWRALIITLLDTGLKRDEVLALHPSDVYLDPDDPVRSYLTVRAANEARRIRARTLPLTSRLVDEIRIQIETGAGDHVFPISVRAVNAIVETCGKRAGLRKRGPISPQMLRDTFAIREVRRRAAVEAEARRSGVTDRELLSLQARHDLEVCDRLGLTPGGTNDPISRYRVLAAARGLR